MAKWRSDKENDKIKAPCEGFFSTGVTGIFFKLEGTAPLSRDLLNSDTSPASTVSNSCLK